MDKLATGDLGCGLVRFDTQNLQGARQHAHRPPELIEVSMCSSGVWSSAESPGPYATMGQPHAGPRRFLSEVPVLSLNRGLPPSARIALSSAALVVCSSPP